jgi:hypothetical protein
MTATSATAAAKAADLATPAAPRARTEMRPAKALPAPNSDC